MRVVDEEGFSNRGQGPVGGVEEGVCGLVVLRANPLALEDAPQRLRDVKVRRVRREVEEEKPSALPNGPHLLHGLAAVDAGVVKHNDNVLFSRPKGQPVKEIRQPVGGYAAPRSEAFVSVVPCGHAEYVESGYLLGWDVDILTLELPSVRDVALGADMALVGIIKVYLAFFSFLFKFLQLLGLVLVELRRGFSPWAFPYTLISCANADKKRLNVDSLASPMTTASSSEQSMIGLRPLPGRVSRPLMPSFSYRFNHFLTVCCSIPVLSPTSEADSPSAFRSKAKHLILKQCLSPMRYPLSSSNRWASFSSNRTAFLISIKVCPMITRIAA